MPFPLFFALAAIGGGAAGIGISKGVKNQLDREAERVSAVDDIDIGLDSASAQNRFDQEQLAVMNDQYISAQADLRSRDPRVRQRGTQRILQLDAAVRGLVQQNESEMRADEVRARDAEIAATGLGLAANERRLVRSMTMNKQLNDELAVFGDAQLAYNKVTNLLDTGDQLASLAALTAFVQSIDDSVVREAELLKYQGANGAIIAIVNLVNKAEGRDFDEATKISLRNASAALINSAKTQAIAITNSYQDRALVSGLDVDVVMSGVDSSMFTPIEMTTEAKDILEQQADAAEQQLAAAPGDFVTVDQTGTERAAASFIAVAEELARNTGMLLRGSKLIRRESDGKLFEQTIDGELIAITEAELLRANRAKSRASDEQIRQRLEEENATGFDRLLRGTPTQPIDRSTSP